MTKLTAIVQMRMSSVRLPGKILRPVLGKPMIGYMLARLKRAKHIDRLILATSEDPSDNPVETFSRENNFACFRGPLDNVALRFKQALDAYSLSAFIRLNGDSPLIDAHLVDQAIELFEEESPDMVTNVFPRSFPKGQSVEVMTRDAFLRAYALMKTPHDFEHVTPVFYSHPQQFRICNFSMPGADRSDINLSVDSPADFERFEKFIQRAGSRWPEMSLADLLNAEEPASRA